MKNTAISTADQMCYSSKATITRVNPPSYLVKRFAALGIVEGGKLEYIKTAPFGDPVYFRIGSNNVCLRKNDAECISVSFDSNPETRSMSKI